MSTWIPISGPGSRLPTREETNGHDTVWAVDECGTHWTWNYVMSPISRFVHPPIAWHAFPRYAPPASGPTDGECEYLWQVIKPLATSNIMPDFVPKRTRDWFADVTARIEKEKAK